MPRSKLRLLMCVHWLEKDVSWEKTLSFGSHTKIFTKTNFKKTLIFFFFSPNFKKDEKLYRENIIETKMGRKLLSLGTPSKVAWAFWSLLLAGAPAVSAPPADLVPSLLPQVLQRLSLLCHTAHVHTRQRSGWILFTNKAGLHIWNLKFPSLRRWPSLYTFSVRLKD